MHSDQESQFTSKEFTNFCRQQGIIQSMSKAGCSYNNAPMERFYGTLKREYINAHQFKDNNLLKATPQEIRDLRKQLAEKQSIIDLLQREIRQNQTNTVSTLKAILNTQQDIQKLLSNQCTKATIHIEESTAPLNKDKEKVQEIQKHFYLLIEQCERVIKSLGRLKDSISVQGVVVSEFEELLQVYKVEIRHLLILVELLNSKIETT